MGKRKERRRVTDNLKGFTNKSAKLMHSVEVQRCNAYKVKVIHCKEIQELIAPNHGQTKVLVIMLIMGKSEIQARIKHILKSNRTAKMKRTYTGNL